MTDRPDPAPASDPPRAAPAPPAESLLLRTSIALGAALVVASVALLLVLRPYLAEAFVREGTALLREHEDRARAAARIDDDVAEATLVAGVAHAWATARAVVGEAPIESASDAAATRTLLDLRLAAAETSHRTAIAGVRPEMLRAGVGHAWETARAVVGDSPIEAAPNAVAVRAMLDLRLAAAEKAHRAALAAVRPEMADRSSARIDAEWRDVAERSGRRAREFGADLAWRAATGLVGLLAVLFLVHGLVLYRSVLLPVTRLAGATRELAEGRLSTRIPVEGDDEVARLAGSFNAMAASLEAALADLRTLNATLEDRVRRKTEEVEARERELRRADKMASLGTLAGGVAHEFNNLLGGIQGCAEDAAREEDAAELRRTLAMIERTARRGAAITQNLLRFARPTEGGRRVVDLAEIAREVAALVEPESTRTGVRVVVDAPRPATVVAEPSGMHQVVLNLVTNAIHAMKGREGAVTIEVSREGDSARVVVRDRGPGISPDHRERLFEPFFTTRAEGTGLGLSVSYGIVRSHGGRIDVESEEGRGAAFVVTLPAADPAGGDT